MTDPQTSLPSHWATAMLEEIAEVRLGRQRSPKRATGDYMRPYMRAANVTWQGISLHDVKSMDFTPVEFVTYELRSGDILLAEASGSASEVGKPAVWKNEVPGACFQNTLIRVRAPERVVPFLYAHFMSDALTGRFAKASRGVGIHHLGAAALSKWQVAFPPIGEQRSIVRALDSYFSRLDDVVATLKRVQRNLKRYRASVLKAAVEGRLVPTEAELARKEGRDYEPADVLLTRILKERRARWIEQEAEKGRAKAETKATKAGKPWTNADDQAALAKARAAAAKKYAVPAPPDTNELPELPEGWCWASVESLYWDAGYGTSQKCTYEASGPPVLRIPNVDRGTIDLGDLKFSAADSGLKDNGLVARGDFLFIRTNGSRNLIGRGAPIIENLSRDCHFASYLIRLRLADEKHLPAWMGLAWHSETVRNQILAGAASSAGQYNVSLGVAKSYAVPLPPRAEADRVISEVARLWSVCDTTTHDVARDLERLARLRQSILEWAFEGKLVDHDPNDEPASVLLDRIKTEREKAQSAAKAKKKLARTKRKKKSA